MKPDFSTMPPATTNSAAPQTPSPIPTQLPEYKPDTQLLRERNRQLLKDIFKATVAFTVASMLTLIAPLHQHIGNASHMAAVATLFFHPCKSVGAMLETTVLGAIGAVFATAIAAVGASTAAYLNAHGRLVESAVFLLFLIFGSTFLLAYIRANSSRIPVYTGTVIAHIIIAIALTAYASQGQLEVDWERLWGLLVPIGCGLLISLLTNILVFPKSATNLLR
jgi:hypothetical protein